MLLFGVVYLQKLTSVPVTRVRMVVSVSIRSTATCVSVQLDIQALSAGQVRVIIITSGTVQGFAVTSIIAQIRLMYNTC